MAKSILGIEFGNSRLKIAEVAGKDVRRFSCTDLPENMVISDQLVAWDSMVDVLKSVIKENGFSSKKVALVVPDAASYVRKLTLPAMTESQLQVNLPYEFHDVIPDDMEKYIFDYAVLEKRNDEAGNFKEMDLLAGAVSKELMEKYMDMFKRAGLKLVKAAPREIAVASLLRNFDPKNKEEDSAVMDLGSTRTLVDYFHDGVYEVTRNIDLGVSEIAKVAGDVLNCDEHIARMYIRDNKDEVLSSEPVINVFDLTATEVMRAMNYYSFENPNNTLNKLYYTGGGSWITPYVQAIANSVSLQLVPLSSLKEDASEALIDGPASVGICLE